jgi:hypothetical protein
VRDLPGEERVKSSWFHLIYLFDFITNGVV